ncbi:rho GTPase-activating protein 30 [Pseudorasbora parva]|uniref:rho GTPase-activating protein 30 n=1 Tax=Pseudorasbora parva TaxID=51549 RepID=UPI00351F3825
MRRGRRKGGSRDKVFGCDLLEHLSSTAQEIPQVLRICSEFIEEHGIVDGIYRLSGVSSNTQKLRSEFDSEGSPDLNKDVYLQDIHCVSSLCKAYFRELPNPLLTYELYDRFADAVAVQLEDERLVKIGEVLKDLPALHHRTLEYLMRHLVKMSTYASETNMHSRNLAIVWAPNLLRSKDIESTGFNGTAAFMEVRVQSIVVEFILTHVPELFPGSGLSVERRKSLPSPSILSGQEDHFFKSLPLGNLSPGDGPLPMRPYHAIIDGTDKRKGSLKGRKWKSIFNLGGRLHDPRKKTKYCPKEKEKTTLRPAKSMDSLSSGPFAVEDSKHSPAHLPPLLLSTASGSSEGVASAGGGVSSGYAVTYRRTGGAQVSMVSTGTPGTYNRLDSGANGAEGASSGVSRSPAMTSKADRRAGIHISGPFSVTVPLHITSGLALGVLHGGWNEREHAEEEEDAKSSHSRTDEAQESKEEVSGCLEKQVDCGKESAENPGPEDAMAARLTPSNEESVQQSEEEPMPDIKEETAEEDYMEMKGSLHPAPVSPLHYEEMEFAEQELELQEAFGFLDSMDNSAPNHVEFSVEAPCFDMEYEEEEDQTQEDSGKPADDIISPSFTHRPLPGKSHSLPYKSRPFLLPPLSVSSDDDYSLADDDDDEESDKGSEYEDMFCHSLPSSRCFQGLSWSGPETTTDTPTDGVSQSERLDGMNATQSEDVIPAAPTSTDNSEEHLSLKREEKGDEKEKYALIREDEGSGEDTYFGPDSIPPSPEPERSDEHPGADADGNHGNGEVTITCDLIAADCISLAPQEDDETKREETEEMKECENNTDKVKRDDDEEEEEEEEAKTGSVEECSGEKEEQKQVSEGERKEDLEENRGEEDEEKEKDEPGKEEEDERKDLEENIGEEDEEKEKDEPGKGEEDERKDLEKNRGEEDEEKEKDEPGKEEDDERKDLEENRGEEDEEKEKDEPGKEEDDERKDLEENRGEEDEEKEKDEPGKEEEDERKDLEEKRGEEDEEKEKDEPGKEEDDERKDLEENSGENKEEKAKDESLKEGERDERTEDLEEKSGEEDEEKAKDEFGKGEEGEKDEEKAKDEPGKEEDERKEDFVENRGKEDEEKEIDEFVKREEGERKDFVEKSVEEDEEKAKDEPVNKQDERKKDLEENSGECEEEENTKDEPVKGEDERKEEDLEEKSVEEDEEKAKDESGKGEEDKRKEYLEESEDGTEGKEGREDPEAPPPERKSVRRVPVVPPKPQNSKLAAMTLRKQLELRHGDAETCSEDEGVRDGEAEPERRKEAEPEPKRNSGISMCFDEAVARATVKRSRERENTDRLSGAHWRDAKTD